MAIFVSSLAAEADPTPTPAEAFRRGCLEFRKGAYAKAAQLFSVAAEHPSSDLRSWSLWFLARARVQSGETEAALLLLSELERTPGATPFLDAAMLKAQTLAENGEPFAAAAGLLVHTDDPRNGPRALDRAGKILLAAGDTGGAVRIWSDLFAMYPASEFAHRAAVRMIELEPRLESIPAYTLLAMARAAATAGDFSTAAQVLDPLTRRAIDRRLRDDVLLVHGEAQFKLSDYARALESYREARQLAADPESVRAADIGIALCRLYLGDSASHEAGLARIRRGGIQDAIAENVENLAAMHRVRGESESARRLIAALDHPTLESFLRWYNETDETATAGRRAAEEADGIRHPADRALAWALLAHRRGSDAADLWRNVIHDADNDVLVAIAVRELERMPPRSDTLEKREAEALLISGLRDLQEGLPERGVRKFRTIVHGYARSEAAEEARRLLSRTIEAYLKGDHEVEDLTAAEALFEAGAYAEAAEELRRLESLPAVEMRIAALDSAGLTHESINATEALVRRAPFPVLASDLPDRLRNRLFPLPLSPLFASAAESYSIRPEALAGLARVRTRFDPTFHEGYRLGIMALDLEATSFAVQFPEAPHLEPQDLLAPARAVPLAAWFLRYLSLQENDTNFIRLVGALHVGPGNVPERGRRRSDLEWIAELPFRSSRAFMLAFMEAQDRYASRFPERRTAPARPRTPPRSGRGTR